MSGFLEEDFFARDFLAVAHDLVGTTLVWDGCRGTVVEVEAYGERDDSACHCATRPSARAFVRDEAPGTAYVYLNYGIHWLLNVLVKDPAGRNGIILFRALDPVAGLAEMRRRRGRDEPADLCSGPGKLGAALALGGDDHPTGL